MAKRSFKISSWTPVSVADGVNFTNQGYCALQGGSATQRTKISEIYVGGQAAASAPTNLVVSYDSVIGVTLTALGAGESDAPLDPATAVLAAPVVPFTQSTTKPQRSATKGLLDMTLNAFGGISWWRSAIGDELIMLGNTAALFGEISLSCFSGGTPGAVGSHVIYETL